MLHLEWAAFFEIFDENNLAYYKLFFALGIRIDDDVIAQEKGELGIGVTIEDYLEPDFGQDVKQYIQTELIVVK